jgi:hypothetical protein
LGNLHFDKNLYLDKRQPEWQQYEKSGFIFFDAGVAAVNPKEPSRMVMVDESLTDVINSLKDSVSALTMALAL